LYNILTPVGPSPGGVGRVARVWLVAAGAPPRHRSYCHAWKRYRKDLSGGAAERAGVASPPVLRECRDLRPRSGGAVGGSSQAPRTVGPVQLGDVPQQRASWSVFGSIPGSPAFSGFLAPLTLTLGARRCTVPAHHNSNGSASARRSHRDELRETPPHTHTPPPRLPKNHVFCACLVQERDDSVYP
jgi:hypothetical protein